MPEAVHIVTFPREQSEGKPPVDFDKRIKIKILDENGDTEEIDEDMLLEAMQDFTQFLPGVPPAVSETPD